MGDLNKIPHGWHLCDGSNGTPNLSGRFLEGVTSEAKQWHDAGLPNITGWIRLSKVDYWDRSSGAFYTIYRGGVNDAGYFANIWYDTDNIIGFDASRSNSIYGRSDTVQPASYTVYYIMRVK